MRNRSTRAIVGLLLLAGVATSGLKQAGLLTGSVLQNSRMQFRAVSPYSQMDTGGIITIPSGTDVLLDWSEVGGADSNMVCYLHASQAIDGIPAAKTYEQPVPNYGVRRVGPITSNVSFTITCDDGDPFPPPPYTSQTLQVRVGTVNTSTAQQYDHRAITYPGAVAPVTFTLTSGSSTNGTDNVLDIKPGADVTLSWTSTGTQDACTLTATDLVNVPTEIAAGTLHPGNTYGGGKLTNALNQYFIVRRTGSMTLRGVSESFTASLQCFTNIPAGGGSAQNITSFRSVYVQPQIACSDGIDNDGDGKIDFAAVSTVKQSLASVAVSPTATPSTILTGLSAGQVITYTKRAAPITYTYVTSSGNGTLTWQCDHTVSDALVTQYGEAAAPRLRLEGRFRNDANAEVGLVRFWQNLPSVTVPAGATKLEVWTVNGYLEQTPQGSCYFDNVKVTESTVPDPQCTSANLTSEASSVDIKVNGQDGTVSVPLGTPVTVTWTSNGVASCDTGTAPAPWGPSKPIATSGTQQYVAPATQTIGIHCTSVGGTNRDTQDSVGINVTAPLCNVTDPSLCGPKGCPGGFLAYNSKTYVRYDTAAGSWDSARAHCQSLGGDLVSINTAAEQTAVYNGLVGTGRHDIWIGLTDSAAEGTFKWVDGTTPSYTNWHTGNPDDGYSNEDCGEMNYKDHPQTGKWNDFRCADGYGDNTGFICELPLNCSAQEAQVYSCKALDFDAKNGTFAAQGWTAAAEPVGSVTAVTEDGVKAMRMTDNSPSTGVSMEMPVNPSVMEDKDWTLEMRAKVRESQYYGAVGVNMLLALPNNRHIGLYIGKNSFGPINNSVAYIQSVNRNTTDAFHTYTIKHKKNASGKNDDAIDVYFDGQKVLSDISVSSMYNQSTVSKNNIVVGQLSSEGQGSMDVEYVRFQNNESPCVTYGSACGVSEFYASDGTFEEQGWSTVEDANPDTNLTGPLTENGVTYVRMSDQSATGGMRTSDLDITNAMLADRDWSLEIKSRTVMSNPNGYVLGMNMVLVTPDEVSTSLFMEPTKFGLQAATPNAYTWGPSVSRNTADAFHTYIIKNKKNAAGASNDTIDVYFDGTKVLSDIPRSQLYVYDAGTGVQGISFGIGSSPGKGTMDVSYVKFKNDEASCPANPFKAANPQCSDGIDNDGDGKIDYWAPTAAIKTFGPVVLPDEYLPAPPDTPKQLRPFTLVTGLTSGQLITIAPIGGTFDNSGNPGSCTFIIGPGKVYIPVDYVNDAGTVIKSEVAWEGAQLTVPTGATQMRGYAPIVTSSCTISGSVFEAPPNFDPNCSSASDDSEGGVSCTDSDGGNNPAQKGFANATGGSVATGTDTCNTNGTLKEYFCDPNNGIQSTTATCENGSACVDGACKAAATSSAGSANSARVGFGGVAFDGNDIIFMPLQNADMSYHGNVLSFGPVCKPGACGNGQLTSDEQCDDGNTKDGDGCSAKCIWEPYAVAAGGSSSSTSSTSLSSASSSSRSSSVSSARCGDRMIGVPETCDDGNQRGGDGCSAFCQVETGWQCTPRLP